MHVLDRLRPRRLAAAFTALGLSAAGLIGFAGVASAHATNVSGTAVCQSDGTYTVTWTVANDYNLSETVAEVSHTGGGTISGLPTTVAASPRKPYSAATVTQTGIPGTARSATLTVNGTWSDGYSQHDSNGVSMTGRCSAPVAPPAPTFTDGTCASPAGSYTIPAASSHEEFQAWNGKHWSTVSTGTYNASAGDSVTIRLVRFGHEVDSWTHTFAGPGDCTTHVSPAAPSVKTAGCDGITPYAGSITINPTPGVIYEVNGNPVTGTITVPGDYTITAVPADKTYTLDGTTSWTLTVAAATTCAAQQPSISVTGTCNNVTYTLGNQTVSVGLAAPALLALQPVGTITYRIQRSTDGGVTYATVATVVVAPGDTKTQTESGAGIYQVLIGAAAQAGSQFTVSGVCSNPNPNPAPVLAVSGTIAPSCPTVAGTTGSYVITLANAAASTESAEFRVAENGTVVKTSGAISAGAGFSYTGVLTVGEAVTITADDSVDGGVTWTAVALTNAAAVVCPDVLAVTFEKPPVPTAPTTPTATLPFTGLPLLPTLLVGFGLVLAGGSLVFASRRRGGLAGI